MKLRAKLRIRNNGIIKARKELGYSQPRLAAVVGIPVSILRELEWLDYSGRDSKFLHAEKLAGFLDLDIKDVYPEELAGSALPSKFVRYQEFHGLELKDALNRHKELPSPTDDADVVQEAVVRQLDNLPERARRVLCLRFGLEGEAPASLEQVAKIIGVTRERIRQIERVALQKIGSRATVCLRQDHDIRMDPVQEPFAPGVPNQASISTKDIAP